MGSQPAYWADPYQQNLFSKLWQLKISCISLVSKAPVIRYISAISICSLIFSAKAAAAELFWSTCRKVVLPAFPSFHLNFLEGGKLKKNLCIYFNSVVNPLSVAAEPSRNQNIGSVGPDGHKKNCQLSNTFSMQWDTVSVILYPNIPS